METSTNVDNNPGTSMPKLKLGQCEVCAVNSSKYTCPKCEIKTCSLICNKIHKSEIECDGQRNRTKFIPLNRFTNLDLSSDYRLLEEVTRAVERYKKPKLDRKRRVPCRLQTLQKAAIARRTMLKFLPKDFDRHKSNSTRFVNGTKEILWRIDWVFDNADNLKLFEENVSENNRLSNILRKYLIKQENKELQEKLQFYQSADFPGIKLLLKAEQKAGQKFYELDATNTLKESLSNKIIIEYPTIHVVLKNHTTPYEILDSDDEEDCKAKIRKAVTSGNLIVEKIIKKFEKDDTAQNSLKNYFIDYEGSDDE